MKKDSSICAILNSSKSFQALEPLSRNRPVSALPFASRYRVIDFMLSNVAHANIESVALFIDTSGRALYDHIRGGKEWDLDNALNGGIFTFSQQTWKREFFLQSKANEGSEFYNNHKQFMKRSNSDYVVVMSGEHVVNIDIEAVINYFKEKNSDATFVYKKVACDALSESSNIKILDVDEDDIIAQSDRNACDTDEVKLNLEVCVLKVETLEKILNQAESDKFYEDIGTVIHTYLKDYTVSGFEYTGYHAIIDSINTYYKYNMEMLDTSKFNSLFHSSLSIITRTKNGTPTFYSEDSDVKNTIAATGCDIYGDVKNSMIFRKVQIFKNVKVTDSIILPGVIIHEKATIAYAILDKGVIIDPGVSIIGDKDNIIVIPKNTHVTKEFKP